MANLPTKNKHILRKVILCIFAIPALFILYVIGTILLSPVFDAVDKAKFDQMDSQTKEIYHGLQAASGGSEEWKYEATCDSLGQGGFQTYPDYSCTTKVSMEIPAVTPQHLVTLHEKYYPIIDSSPLLRSNDQLDKQKPGEFGVAFVVSSAEKHYQFRKDGESCDYLAKLAQPYSVSKSYDFSYGAGIEDGGRIILSFSCTAIAQDNWYQ